MVNLEAFALNFFKLSSLLTLLCPTFVSGECTCDISEATNDEPSTLNYKLASIASILVAGGLGVSLPLLGKRVKALNPENDVFLMVKAFAAGVILATGFIHILPHAFELLTSPCLSQNPRRNFPFAGFIAMMTAIGTLVVDSFATGFYQKVHYSNNKIKQFDVGADEEIGGDRHAGHVHVHTHATHGHAHGSAALAASSPHHEDLVMSHELIRKRIISQVLELGIVVHSVIIGVSLGASNDPNTIKPLLVALSFHQFFEGLGLGGCISQAQFKSRSMAIMATFFSMTTPVGIAIGIGVSSIYVENGQTTLMVEGVFNSASAGILIYMALVDLLAQDFIDPRMQANLSIQLGAYISLLLGSACMSVLAKWA